MNNSFQASIVIGGLWGSGTRVLARVVRRAGYFLGTNVTGAEDAVEFWEFYDRWINRYLLREQAPFCREEEELMNNDFVASVARPRLGVPSYDSPWGWKEPRSHFLLPFFHAKYPAMKLIHVIRDGRDMAFSNNQNQLRRHGAAVLEPAHWNEPQPVRTARLWARINLAVADFGKLNMGEKYCRIYFEELCRSPLHVIEQLLEFLGCSSAECNRLRAGVNSLESIGRWRTVADAQLMSAVEAEAREALIRFDYC